MTLQELSDAWNALDVAALGRGTTAPISPALAARAQRESREFRAWMSELGPFDELRERVIASDAARSWVGRYNALRLAVAQEGRAVPGELELPKGALDELTSTLMLAAVAGVLVFALLRRKG